MEGKWQNNDIKNTERSIAKATAVLSLLWFAKYQLQHRHKMVTWKLICCW